MILAIWDLPLLVVEEPPLQASGNKTIIMYVAHDVLLDALII